MAATSPTYQRLTRNASGGASYSSLWLGDDHLIIVKSTGYQESYTRLQLSEVKGIFITRSKRRLAWAIFWGIILGFSSLGLVMTLMARETPFFSVLFSVVGAVGLIWNYILGEGCKAHVVTGVQTAELPALIRLNKTRKVIARLQPLITALQANLVVAPPMMPVPTPAADVKPPAAS